MRGVLSSSKRGRMWNHVLQDNDQINLEDEYAFYDNYYIYLE